MSAFVHVYMYMYVAVHPCVKSGDCQLVYNYNVHVF